ncbi:MAG TPA: response regulator, partial [Mycobacterium sp.]|nr:response regulator [Mycobacterium sp.]
FDEFAQLPSPLQGRVKGTGLGLPLCRRLAHLLGGEVSVKSERGVGSVFTATVYANFETNGIAAAEPVDTTVELGRSPVLVLDDDAEMRRIYDKHLRDSRYQPLSARTLREARELLKRTRPQAILLDIVLRGEDTWRWLSELKSDPATASIPVKTASHPIRIALTTVSTPPRRCKPEALAFRSSNMPYLALSKQIINCARRDRCTHFSGIVAAHTTNMR